MTSASSGRETLAAPGGKRPFPHRNLLGISQLNQYEILELIDRAEAMIPVSRQQRKSLPTLSGKTQINLFFEPSTRTQASFEIAGKRLGAQVTNMSVKTSSVAKGETLVDTAATLNAMQPDVIIVRHPASGAVELLSQKVGCAVINAGDGAHEHPTQALLDALTIRQHKGRLAGLTVAICGDIAHSRVARSNLLLLGALQVRTRVIAPRTLLPKGIDALTSEVFTDMRDGLAGADVVMMLRLQHERAAGRLIPSVREYYRFYGLDAEKLALAKPDAIVMHPGPMNRGVEIDPAIADGPRSVITHQVEMGVAVRMAVLDALLADPSQVTWVSPPIVIANARIIDPASNTDRPGAVLIADGRIAGLAEGAPQGVPDGATRVDARGLIVAPGLIDMRVFTGEPGHEYRETLATAAEAAAAGGVTSFVLMPDTTPVVDDGAIVDFIVRRAAATAKVHVLPAAAITKGLGGEEITEFGLLREAGAVCLSDGRRSIQSAGLLRAAMTYAANFDMAIVHHVADATLVGDGVMNEGTLATISGLNGIPDEAETVPLARDLQLAALTGVRYHAAQVSTAGATELLAAARGRSAGISAGVSINNLALNENNVAPYRTFFKLSPPLRSEDDRQAMIEALRSGVIDVIHSAHDPQDSEVKRQPFAEASEDAIGLETLLAAGLRLVHSGDVPLMIVLRAMTQRPAEILGLPSGRLAIGAPADLILIDPEFPWVVAEADIVSRSHNTAFEGARLQGAVMQTFVAGRSVFRHARWPEGAA